MVSVYYGLYDIVCLKQKAMMNRWRAVSEVPVLKNNVLCGTEMLFVSLCPFFP